MSIARVVSRSRAHPEAVPSRPDIQMARPGARSLWAVWLGLVDYRNAQALQLSLVESRARDALPDVVLLLEHPPTITCGRATSGQEVAHARRIGARYGIDLVEAERGGQLTFHGPGQLVAYPIVHLDAVGRDLHRWLATLEGAVAKTLDSFGLRAVAGRPQRGVWVEGRKVASVGVAVRRWVSYHGAAINVAVQIPELPGVSWCGMESARYASMADFGVRASVAEVGRAFAQELAACLGRQVYHIYGAGADRRRTRSASEWQRVD